MTRKIKLSIVILLITASTSYSQKGKLTTTYYYKDLKESEGNVDKDGNKTGEWKYWDYDGRLCETIEFKAGLKSGVKTVERKTMYKSAYKLEIIQKDEISYQKSIKRQAKDKLDTIILKENYVNDLKDGFEFQYNENGILLSEINFKAGKIFGLEKKYNPEEKVELENYHSLNGIDSTISYENHDTYNKRRWLKTENGSECYFYLNNVLIKSANRAKSGDILKIAKCNWENGKIITCDTTVLDLTEVDEYGRKRESSTVYIVEIPKNKEEKTEVEDIFDVVEEQPEYPGGLRELSKFIITNFKPDTTKLTLPINGKVYVSFVVRKDGNITDAKIMRSMNDVIDKEALRVINLMPKWKPGKQRGKEVNVRYNLPIPVKI